MEKGSVPLLAVLISGRGSNLSALLTAIREGRLTARVAVVVSNRPEAAGLDIARQAGVEAITMPHRSYTSRDDYDRALAAQLAVRNVRLVCLAGFMRVLGPAFCAAFPDAILNVHPSLLPSFSGVEAQRQAIDHGVRVSGATVHFVTPDLDAGPIVAQEAIPVEDHDDADSLSRRILAVEHRLYPAAVARVLEGRWKIAGRRVVWSA